MDIIHNLFRKNDQECQIPISTSTPFATDAVLIAGVIQFKCPTCPGTVSVALEKIDPIIGINIACPGCKGISHVPGVYKIEDQKTIILCENCSQKLRVPFTEPAKELVVTCPKCRHEFAYHAEPKLPNNKICGSVRVPIANFSDLYYEHPIITSLISKGDSDILNDYGLWAFCAKCNYQFPSHLLTTLAINQSMAKRGGGEMLFMANSSQSAKDMNALRAGHCSRCNHKDLIVVVTVIPDRVRTAVQSKKK